MDDRKQYGSYIFFAYFMIQYLWLYFRFTCFLYLSFMY